VKRRIIVAIAAAVLSLGVAAPAAYAVPDFGPGNSSKGPNDGGRSAILRARRRRSLAASRSRSTEALCGLRMAFPRPHFPVLSTLRLARKRSPEYPSQLQVKQYSPYWSRWEGSQTPRCWDSGARDR
jgi:hypothetical protein